MEKNNRSFKSHIVWEKVTKKSSWDTILKIPAETQNKEPTARLNDPFLEYRWTVESPYQNMHKVNPELHHQEKT